MMLAVKVYVRLASAVNCIQSASLALSKVRRPLVRLAWSKSEAVPALSSSSVLSAVTVQTVGCGVGVGVAVVATAVGIGVPSTGCGSGVVVAVGVGDGVGGLPLSTHTSKLQL